MFIHRVHLYVTFCLFVLLNGCRTAPHQTKEAARPPSEPLFSLTVLHVNDTHSYFDPSIIQQPNGEAIRCGGYPAIQTFVQSERATNEHALFLHAGDVFQGTGYFVLNHGAANAELLNLMRPDAMTIGNHEFDQLREMNITWSEDGSVAEQIVPGSKIPLDLPLARFAQSVHFPLVAANVEFQADPYLAETTNITPWTLCEVQGEKIGVFGILLDDMPSISSPGKDLIFERITDAAQDAVEQLSAEGVNKIIMLSHIGYRSDCRVAGEVSGIDLIVGGHSHDLLGDFTNQGFAYAGPYPTVVTSPAGETVCVVQAGSYALAVGKLDVQFDPSGRIQSWSGGNTLLVLADDTTATNALREDPAMRALIDEKYRPELLKTYGPVIAQVPAPLNHERTPTDPEGHGSEVAPLAAEAFCLAMEDLGITVDAGLVNAGGVRTSIASGDYFKNQTLLEVMIFGNSLCDFQLTGADIKRVFETVINSALANPDGDGRFPYTARLAYVYDPEQPTGSRITSLRFLDREGTWSEAEDARLYHLVSNSYVADGNDGYETLKAAMDAQGPVTRHADLIDNQAFTAYVQRQAQEGRELVRLPYSPVTLKSSHETQPSPY